MDVSLNCYCQLECIHTLTWEHMYVLIIQDNFGTTLCRHLMQKNLSGDILGKFHCFMNRFLLYSLFFKEKMKM